MDIVNATQLRNTVLQNNAQESAKKAEFINSLSSDKARKEKQLKEVAESFEQIFINMMFSSMRDTLNKKDDILNGGFSQEIFEDMLYKQYSEDAAKTSYLGLGDMIVSQYSKYI